MSRWVKGGNQVRADIRKAIGSFYAVAPRALYIEGEIEMTEAKRRTPVDTGTLRASGHTKFPVWIGKVLRMILSFGGAAEQYAIIVHEDLDANHRIGQAKYLESVLNESEPYMLTRIARRIQSMLGGA